MRPEPSGDRLGGLALLASALSHRALQVAAGGPGEAPWTDGKVVYLDPGAGPRQWAESLAVQASLLAAGSLEPELLQGLGRRPSLARRYLAFEGHRALAELAPLLPPPLRTLVDPEIAARVDSPAASLAAARSRAPVADPPQGFGVIHARRLLASVPSGARTAAGSGEEDAAPGPPPQRLRELAEDEREEVQGPDLFSSPVGGSGALGRLLGRMLRPVRRLEGGGPVGADAPTRWSGDGLCRGRAAPWIRSAAIAERGPVEASSGRRYPEWDAQRRRYRPDWCTVREVEAEPKDGARFPLTDRHGLRRPLARLGLGLERLRRQPQGDEVDIDAAVEARVELAAGSPPDEAFYVDSLRRRRDLSVLLLLDVSGSAGEPAAAGLTLHERQCSVAASLVAALHAIGDRVALYAFRSQGRSSVQLLPLRRFEEELDSRVAQRLHGLVPCAYSRLGAAIRHGAALLEERGGTSRRLLVVLSDGLAYDHGYEPAYGAADARRALGEARRSGVGCLCLSFGAGAGADREGLQRVFGSAAHAALTRPDELGRLIGPLFREALRSAEGRRRRSQGRRSAVAGDSDG